MTTKPKKVQVKLAGDPTSSLYNFGTADKPDWKKGGDVLQVDIDLAERLVKNKQATSNVTELQNLSNTQPAEVAPGGSNFDQDQTEPKSGEKTE